MKNSSTFGLVLIIITTLLLIASAGAAGLYLYKESQRDTDSNYFITESVISDGGLLDENGLKQYFNTDKLSDVMCLYLKDTGDCGVFMEGNGQSCSWHEKGEKDIIIEMPDQKLNLRKRWEKLVYETKYAGKEFEITLIPAERMPTCFREHPEFTFGIKYDKGDTRQLCNYMLDGYYLIHDQTLYGKFFVDGKSVFGSRKIKAGESIKVGDLKVIKKDGQAKFLVKKGKYFYYLWAPANGSTESICRMSISNGKVKTLREGDVDYVQVRFGKIYFADADYKFCSMGLDGGNEQVIIDREIYMPYIIDKNWIIYQDDKDHERLHLASLGTDYDLALSKERTYAWTIKDKELYYTSTGEKEDEQKHKCKLHRINLDSVKNAKETSDLNTEVGNGNLGDVFAINEKYILGGDGEAEKFASWKGFSNKLYEATPQKTYLMFLYGNYRICGHVNKKGGFTGIYLDNISTGDGCEITH